MTSTLLVQYGWWLVGLLLALSLKVLLLALVVGAGLTLGRIRSATWAHRAWSFCLVAMLAMPLLAILAPTIPLPGPESLAWQGPEQEPTVDIPTTAKPSVPSPAPVANTEPPRANQTLPQPEPQRPAAVQQSTPSAPPTNSVVAPVIAPSPALPSQAIPSTNPPWPHAVDLLVVGLATLYLIGGSIMLGRFAWSFLHCRRLIQRSVSAEIPEELAQLSAGTKVLQSPDTSVPLCLGIGRATILLPEDWKTWNDSLLRMVLSHEAEHVRRRDPLIACLAAISTTLYWFHPVAWWLQRTLADLAEHACDDAVIGELGERNQYARILLDMARRVSEKGRRLQPICVGMARKHEIEERVERVIDLKRPLAQRIGLKASTLLLTLVAATALVTAGLTITSQVLAQDEATAKEDNPTIRGIVQLPDDKPAINAEVRLLTYNKAKSNYDHRTTQTDATGKFQFDNIKPGNHRVAAFLDDLASRSQRYKMQRVQPGDEVELKLSKAPALEVHVLKQADDKPIPDARVRLTWSDLQRDHIANAEGIAVIRGLTDEEWTFEVQAKGYAESEQKIQLTGNDTTSVTVKLKPGFAAFGTVRDDQGKPVPDVGISAFEQGLRSGQLEYTKTDAEGTYRFDYLPLTGIQFFINEDGYQSHSPVLQQTGPPMGARQFDITLTRSPFGGSITGTVLDTNGKPIAGAKISNQGQSSRLVRETETDAEGKYLLENLYASLGEKHIVVQADRFAPQKLLVTPGPQEKPAVYNLTLEPGRTISGTVLGPDKQPLSNVLITYRGPFSDQSEMRRATKTDAAGKFTLDSLTQTAPLTFQKPNYSIISDRNFPPESNEPIVVQMMPEGVIRGTVVDDQTGKPVTDYVVHITFSPDKQPGDPNGPLIGTQQGQRVVNAQGKFERGQLIHKMPLQVTIQADGYQKEVHTRVVVASDTTAQPEEFRLKAIDRSMLKTFAGQVVDAAGKPVVGVQLRLIAARNRRDGSRNEFPFNWTMVTSGQLKSMADVSQFLTASTDAEGRFTFTDVSPSPDIEIAYWGGGVTLGRLPNCERLDQQQRTHLVIKTIATGSLSGQINRERFQEISRVMLSSVEAHYTAQLSSDGKSYQFEDVSSGNYTVHVYGPDREVMLDGRPSRSSDVIFSHAVRIRPGQHETVDLGMQPTPPDKEEVAMPQKPQPKPPAIEEEVPEGQIRLAGQVLTPAGEGIPQAKLWLPKHYREILAETVADDDGRFSMLVPRQAVDEDRTYGIGTLWGYAAGHQIGSISVAPQLKQGSTEPVGMILEEATDAGIVVESPDGPVAGARLEPLNYKTERGYDLVPLPLRELVGGLTNSAGLIKLPACNRELLSSVVVTADQFGEQNVFIYYGSNVSAIETIELKSTGRVEGQLTAENDFDFTGTEVSVSPTHFGSLGSVGSATCTADKEGRFVMPVLAAGEYQIYARHPDKDSPLQARLPGPVKVTANETTNVTISFEPAITATGKLQTQDEKKPIEGAWLIITQGGLMNIRHAFSDENGIYTAKVLPGQQASVQLVAKPTQYMNWPEDKPGRQPINIPADAQEAELPTIELIPTFPVEGKLIDAFDRPVEGVQIVALKQGRAISYGKPDAAGKFTLHLPQGFEVEQYSVSSDDPPSRVTPKVVSESPLVLKLP
ncbi:carboxypeptidase regulatory-like domain-containing protein [Blastopirellula marina]|uniref:Peptidase M56 domain-containing protein n=1 Tax=Blastopirellula marina TaxID=124 RepID=A0A2S8G136_9BACT|nr:carboxypeptidase regulatory-like domain-containing protein [Blastopirellula marina]PQO38153.1 hypothetical protein C5Y98_08745 [Blastopirellula marina]PTL44809.1 hypothetical protein C5Y97_08750 [Blastopirellula marina]